MDELIQKLRETLATNFAFYLKAHMFHWNVEGQNFSEYHEFWAKVYEDLFAQSDVIAEFIRQAGEYAPGSLEVYKSISKIEDEESFLNAKDMFSKFLVDNDKMVLLYNQLYAVAEKTEQYQI